MRQDLGVVPAIAFAHDWLVELYAPVQLTVDPVRERVSVPLRAPRVCVAPVGANALQPRILVANGEDELGAGVRGVEFAEQERNGQVAERVAALEGMRAAVSLHLLPDGLRPVRILPVGAVVAEHGERMVQRGGRGLVHADAEDSGR